MTEKNDAENKTDRVERPMEMGLQPLDAVLEELGLKNSDLVKASREQLSHKMAAKGRKGRRLTLNVRMKIVRALNKCQFDQTFAIKDLFNY